ncbi:MAG: alpha/beta hydrolase [Candidatus Sabulitectum sp.]|nr:alpha/beta hydrolase [Candidatus Sabulitectum sp.]
MASFSVNGVNLYYEVHGSGEPLLLIAGLASDSQSWLPVVEELASYYQVILPDNRGVGRTEPQDVEISIKAIADDCMALLSYLGFSSANILGHSMGGFAALDCAIRYPERVSKLILESTSVFCSPRNTALFSDWYSYLQNGMALDQWFRNIFYWIFSEGFFNDIGALQNAVRSAVEYPYPQTVNAFGDQVKAIEAFNCQEELKNITSKTLAVFGREDILFSPDENARVLNRIPGIVVSTVEHAAHSVHMEKPDEFVRIVRNFLI